MERNATFVNLALKGSPFSRLTLSDKAAQRRLALRSARPLQSEPSNWLRSFTLDAFGEEYRNA